MMFMGAMMLIVLPIFLIICIRMIRASGFAKKPAGIILETIFLLSIALSLTGFLYFVAQIIKSL
jgi:hypothetical protein